jgi:hypothetical protein
MPGRRSSGPSHCACALCPIAAAYGVPAKRKVLAKITCSSNTESSKGDKWKSLDFSKNGQQDVYL